jgi:L-cysteine S-thiosulfotransferase
MSRFWAWIAFLVTLAAAIGCGGRHSASGFRLPDTGDVKRGQAVFAELECHTCHQVPGADLPKPTAQPFVPVALGGETLAEMPDGYLVTSIINPSYKLAAYPKDQITVNGHSRMPDYTDRLSVRQLTDLVAFLQSHYTVRQPPARSVY